MTYIYMCVIQTCIYICNPSIHVMGRCEHNKRANVTSIVNLHGKDDRALTSENFVLLITCILHIILRSHTAAELDKLKAANKKLDGELADARKEAVSHADATKDVEKKLKDSEDELEKVKKSLEATSASAADKEKSLGASAAALQAEKDQTAKDLAAAKAATGTNPQKSASETCHLN